MGKVKWFGGQESEVEHYTISPPFYDVMQADGVTMCQEGYPRVRDGALVFEDYNGSVLFAYAPGHWIKTVKTVESKHVKVSE